jgi:hypothetical protein
MLTAAEIRIGNYLFFISDSDESEIKPVTSTDIVDIEFSNADGYEPVPLTAELLQQASFQYSSGTDLEFIIDDKNKLIASTFVDGAYIVQLSCHGNFLGQKLSYLHQLQNLFFALTGRELLVDIHSQIILFK